MEVENMRVEKDYVDEKCDRIFRLGGKVWDRSVVRMYMMEIGWKDAVDGRRKKVIEI